MMLIVDDHKYLVLASNDKFEFKNVIASFSSSDYAENFVDYLDTINNESYTIVCLTEFEEVF